MIRVCVLAGNVERLDRQQSAQAFEMRRCTCGDNQLGLVVRTQYSQQRNVQPALFDERLYRVLDLDRPGAVVAHAGAASTAGVFRDGAQPVAFCKQDHARSAFGLLEAPAQPLFGKYPAHEIEIGFAVLTTIAACHGAIHELSCVAAPAPSGHWAIGSENRVDNLDDGLVLPYAAVTHLAKAPGPWSDPYPIAGKSSVATQHGDFIDLACETAARTLGQAYFQRCLLPEQGFKSNVSTGGQDDDVAHADLLHGVVGVKGFDQKLAQARAWSAISDP